MIRFDQLWRCLAEYELYSHLNNTEAMCRAVLLRHDLKIHEKKVVIHLHNRNHQKKVVIHLHNRNHLKQPNLKILYVKNSNLYWADFSVQLCNNFFRAI